MNRKIAVIFTAAVFTLGACGGGGGSDDSVPENITDDTAVLVKNKPLNKCVSVQSGQRPTRPLTREEQIKQREAEIAAMPPECRPKR